jgi:hypothetical protein
MLGAVVGQVLGLQVVVEHRVVRPVGVVGRDDPDVDVLDDVGGRRVGVAGGEQPLDGLQRDQRRYPFAGVVLGDDPVFGYDDLDLEAVRHAFDVVGEELRCRRRIQG